MLARARSLLSCALLLAGCTAEPYVFIASPSSGTVYATGTAVEVSGMVWDRETPTEELTVEAFFGITPVPLAPACSGLGPLCGQFDIDHSDVLHLLVQDREGNVDGARVLLCIEDDASRCSATGAIIGDEPAAETGDSSTGGDDTGASDDSGEAAPSDTSPGNGTDTAAP